MPASVPHTDETKEMLRVMWNKKMSARQIGDALGLSRNAIIGLVTRCRRQDGEDAWPMRNAAKLGGLTRKNRSKPRAVPKQRSKVSAPQPKPKRAPVAAPKPTKPISDPIAWLSRELSQCAFIADDPLEGAIEDLTCCGAPVVGEGSYCAYHRDICTIPANTPKPNTFRLSRIGVGA